MILSRFWHGSKRSLVHSPEDKAPCEAEIRRVRPHSGQAQGGCEQLCDLPQQGRGQEGFERSEAKDRAMHQNGSVPFRVQSQDKLSYFSVKL